MRVGLEYVPTEESKVADALSHLDREKAGAALNEMGLGMVDLDLDKQCEKGSQEETLARLIRRCERRAREAALKYNK